MIVRGIGRPTIEQALAALCYISTVNLSDEWFGLGYSNMTKIMAEDIEDFAEAMNILHDYVTGTETR